ncbi:hypothetical protein [Tepidibacter formicigenes]|jgi:hypothetical protein|uniref:Uncharacterized protein n=1 Tax=Tepidibacter formicigenes DSM 15518 TaxID=1123349 RepID=A0A1M6SNQ5_9FIRM|nr:hypothetical protein [Tepidibacter formicigenes]SHK46277.1 hypothetical protein SAMN02744037_02392 [Tepidibacter formicigenes DSM 15518]
MIDITEEITKAAEVPKELKDLYTLMKYKEKELYKKGRRGENELFKRNRKRISK